MLNLCGAFLYEAFEALANKNWQRSPKTKTRTGYQKGFSLGDAATAGNLPWVAAHGNALRLDFADYRYPH